MLKQKEIGLAMLAIRKAMNIIDDGNHNMEYYMLTLVSSKLFSELNNENQEKFKIWIEKKGSDF